MSAVGDARKRTQQTPAGTLTDTEREALDRALEDTGCHGFLGDHPDLYVVAESIVAAHVEAAVAAALAPVEALADEHERTVSPAPYTSERALIERLRAALAGGGDRG